MIAKIIVASIIGLVAITGLILAFEEVIKEHSAADDRGFFGAMIALSTCLLTIIIFWFAYFI